MTWDSYLVTSFRVHATQRERILRSQCTIDLFVEHADNVLPSITHECTKPRAHPGWHQCWCGALFAPDGRVLFQDRLPEPPTETPDV